MNVKNNNVESLYITITCITFFVFVLNVVVINLAPKIVNVSCDDNVVNLSYIIIVPFCAYTFMLECFFESMKEIIFDVYGLKCVSLRNNILNVFKLYLRKTSFLCDDKDLVLK
jgi:uncharacterized membrane protein (DUF485 family)